jgi:thiopeptide-type bacteriocin biosynthesis protein
VLALAQWTVSGSVFRTIDALPAAPAFSALQDLRARLKLPRFVMLVDADNKLPVDFENVLSLQSFIKVAKRAATVVLGELFPAPDELPAQGEEGRFHHELVMPFVRRAPAGNMNSIAPVHVIADPARRRKPPGSDWLFVKIYCGIASADRLLTGTVAPLVAALRAERAIDRWFFVRHADPRRHLRLRFRGEPSLLWNEVAPQLLACLGNARDVIHNLAIGTYDREEGRYGGEYALDVAERIFEADSDAVLAIVQRYGSDIEARWRLALRGMDALLENFGFSVHQKRQVVDACRSEQISHHGYDGLKRQLGDRYRRFRSEVEALLVTPPDIFIPGVQAIEARSRTIEPLVAVLGQLKEEGRLLTQRTALAGSYLHMWANRMFRTSGNAQELVLYEFLHRIYEGRIERKHAGDS